MLTATWLLLSMGLLGAADIVFFHTRAHRLRQHAPARGELLTHALRGPTYCVLFATVPNATFAGGWFWALLGVLAFDLAISFADFWLEPDSRRALGGLPRGEYLLHVVLAMLFGGLVASVLHESAPTWNGPTQLTWSDAVPTWLRLLLGAMAVGVMVSGLQDFAAVRRLPRVSR